MITEAHFNRATLECMTALRRRIKQDSGISISLADPDAAQKLISLSSSSQLPEVQALGKQLVEILAPPAAAGQSDSAMNGAIASRRLAAQNPRQMRAPAPTVPNATSPSVRIYRGQIVR